MIKLIFILRLQKLIFKSLSYKIVSSHKASECFDIHSDWALFTGTVGPNNKSIIYTQNGSEGAFIKVANSDNAAKLLVNEAEKLQTLNLSNIKGFVFPKVLFKNNNILKITDISTNGKRLNRFSQSHMQSLVELEKASSFKAPLEKLEFWKDLKKALAYVSVQKNPNMPKGIIKKLGQIVSEVDDRKEYLFTLSHGDFTSWNMYEVNGQLHIYDWELSSSYKPLGFDAHHFIIQNGILQGRRPWPEIKRDINKMYSESTTSIFSSFSINGRNEYLKLYLIFNIVYYLKVYNDQKVWHPQIQWLLNTWNEALSEFCPLSKTHREVVILDVFDYLNGKNYAALKFPNISPDELGIYSDLDLCMEKSEAIAFAAALENHTLVAHIVHDRKSFMHTMNIIFKDGSMLSIDIIWKLKYKNLMMFDLGKLLSRTYKNEFGVRLFRELDVARFIGLFYILNKGLIPEKYKITAEVFGSSKSTLDKHLHQFFKTEKGNRDLVLHYLKKKPQNNGLGYLSNSIAYIGDTIGTMMNKRGLTITFSGVDGAGKSTIIEQVKHKIEKQFRKRVVVLRHRPSILPILSAWTKGKAVAEKEAAEKLPRQGNNRSSISSMLRFSYYYVDYVLGQFVIYFRYILRGYVVLYDRYYFDFINDAKRSNIHLPASLARLGYVFLLKPKYNFFLFADPQTILSRKKELDENTIVELTEKYKNLFSNLSAKDQDTNYISIKNENMEKTLNTIFYRIAPQVV